MDSKEIRRIFYRDGYRLAHSHMGEELTAPHLRSAIAQLYQAMDDLIDSFLARTASDGKLAQCKKGCAWCCYQEVFAVTHEFLYVQDFILKHFNTDQQEKILERAREKVLLTMNLPVEERLKVRVACPFLEIDSCMVYEARPMACRIYLSSSLSSCKRDHDQPSGGKSIPAVFEFPLLAGRMLNEGFVAFLKQSGIRSLELSMEQGYASMKTMGPRMEDWVNRY